MGALFFFPPVTNGNGRDPQNEWPLLRLKEKAFVMGRDHLDLKSMAEEVEAAAALDGITEALDRWDRQSHHAAMKVATTPNRFNLFTMFCIPCCFVSLRWLSSEGGKSRHAPKTKRRSQSRYFPFLSFLWNNLIAGTVVSLKDISSLSLYGCV